MVWQVLCCLLVRAASDHHGRWTMDDLARYSTRIQLELWPVRLLCSALCELMANSSSTGSIINSSDNFAANHLKVCKHFANLPTFISLLPCLQSKLRKKLNFVILFTLLSRIFVCGLQVCILIKLKEVSDSQEVSISILKESFIIFLYNFQILPAVLAKRSFM